jgi:lipid-binding SYLF domain-containing protein
MTRFTLAILSFALATTAATAAPPPGRTLEDAATVLDELAAIPAKGLPPKLLADAHGIAIVPRVVKAGFVVAGRGGHGVVLAKDKDGNWSDPVFVNLGGGSIGFQVGVESTDVVLVFRTRKGLDRLLDGKNKLTLGADASVAAGPVGRQAQAATDGKLEAEIVSYSRSRGLFAGVSLDGTVLNADARTNAAYQKDPAAEDKKLAALKGRLLELSGTKAEKPVVVEPPVTIPAVPPSKKP